MGDFVPFAGDLPKKPTFEARVAEIFYRVLRLALGDFDLISCGLLRLLTFEDLLVGILANEALLCQLLNGIYLCSFLGTTIRCYLSESIGSILLASSNSIFNS